MSTDTTLDWPDEPTAAELAAIEAEWPLIAAEMAAFDRLVAFDALAAVEELTVADLSFSLS
ncbi:DUF6284 family protein [Glycomyces xiaoerkulensis]|uniref:DUF6284 family protein n=1 Tax=Glycomyces xiaoerkulensis TaxID=2038139 RepID=UPI000C259403|nr:DUF6284 family protein [Glycomyces xiaoerkulensis]